MADIQPTTWHILGLSVAASYTVLGAVECLMPRRAAQEFFGITATSPNSDSRVVRLLLPLLGARDLSIAAALFAFGRQRRGPEMGTVILAGTILCVADVVAIWRTRGARLGGLFAAGAAVWTGIGLGLLRS